MHRLQDDPGVVLPLLKAFALVQCCPHPDLRHSKYYITVTYISSLAAEPSAASLRGRGDGRASPLCLVYSQSRRRNAGQSVPTIAGTEGAEATPARKGFLPKLRADVNYFHREPHHFCKKADKRFRVACTT